MKKHGLCILETSQGQGMRDMKYCGWRVVKCGLASIWETFKPFILIMAAILYAMFLYNYFGKTKIEIPAKPAVLQEEKKITVTVTAYSPTKEECDDDPFTTAFNKKVKQGTIAISRDLEKIHGWRIGDRISIGNLGVFIVWDRMHPRWRRRVDVFYYNPTTAKKFGIQKAVAVKL